MPAGPTHTHTGLWPGHRPTPSTASLLGNASPIETFQTRESALKGTSPRPTYRDPREGSAKTPDLSSNRPSQLPPELFICVFRFRPGFPLSCLQPGARAGSTTQDAPRRIPAGPSEMPVRKAVIKTGLQWLLRHSSDGSCLYLSTQTHKLLIIRKVLSPKYLF